MTSVWMKVEKNVTKNKNLFCLWLLPLFKSMKSLYTFQFYLDFLPHMQFSCESELGHLGPRLVCQHEEGVSECLSLAAWQASSKHKLQMHPQPPAWSTLGSVWVLPCNNAQILHTSRPLHCFPKNFPADYSNIGIESNVKDRLLQVGKLTHQLEWNDIEVLI